MNNLVFYNEDGKLHTELQEYTEIENCDDPKLKCFNSNDKPCYLKIYFHDDLLLDELSKVYFCMIDNGLVNIDEPYWEMAKDDLDKNNGSMFGGSFEIRTFDVRSAYKCGVDLMNYFCEPTMGKSHVEKIEVILSDEPSEGFVKMMERKKNSASVKNTPINEGV